jgi:hypothetical protein
MRPAFGKEVCLHKWRSNLQFVAFISFLYQLKRGQDIGLSEEKHCWEGEGEKREGITKIERLDHDGCCVVSPYLRAHPTVLAFPLPRSLGLLMIFPNLVSLLVYCLPLRWRREIFGCKGSWWGPVFIHGHQIYFCSVLVKVLGPHLLWMRWIHVTYIF